jgi:predicted metal-dependent peptidase
MLLAVDISGSLPHQIRKDIAETIDALRHYEKYIEIKAVDHEIHDVNGVELIELLLRQGAGTDWKPLVKFMQDPGTPMICLVDDSSYLPPHVPNNTLVIDVSRGVQVDQLMQLIVSYIKYYNFEA